MPSPARWVAATLVLVLSLAIVAVVVLTLVAAPVAVGPSAGPDPSTSAAPTSGPTGTPGASASPIGPNPFAEIEEHVAELRGLDRPEIGRPEVITRAQLAIELEAIFDRDMPPDEVERDNFTLRALGLLDADQDVRQLTEQLFEGQVLGFYDPADQRMVIVSDAGLTPQARFTYAHEYTHALQDAAFDAVGEGEPEGNDDEAIALSALVEGDAVTSMTLWAIEHLTPEELLEITQTPVPDMTGIPEWMSRQLQFPYEAGATFALDLWQSGGFDAVDAAFEDLPASTEQVIHPEAYAAGELPLDVAIPELAATLETSAGGSWELVEETTLGEAMIRIWLGAMGIDEGTASAAAAGWGGDRLAAVGGAGDDWALAWRIRWDAPAEAAEFEAAFNGIVGPQTFSRAIVRVSQTETLVLHASSAAILDAARGVE